MRPVSTLSIEVPARAESLQTTTKGNDDSVSREPIGKELSRRDSVGFLTSDGKQSSRSLEKEVVEKEKIMKRVHSIVGKRMKEGKKLPDHEFILQATTYKAQLERRRMERRLVFRPGESRLLNNWDIAGIIVLSYTALFTPFEVAFMPGLEDSSAWLEPRFIIARFIDLFFTADLFLQFFISFRRYSTSDDGHAAGVWVEDHRQIAVNYLSSWFWFDLGTLVPSIFDILPTVSARSEEEGGFGGATIFRTFRVLRFVKILRVARAGRVMQRWASRITLQHSTKTVLWCIIRLLLAVHWFACVFALQASLHHSAQETWMSRRYYDYCSGDLDISRLATFQSASELAEPPPSPPASPPMAPLAATADEWCPGLTPGAWYIAAFTWSLMIITGTGGTDFYPSSESTAETVIVLLLTFCGAILWTQILADFCDVASNGAVVATEPASCYSALLCGGRVSLHCCPDVAPSLLAAPDVALAGSPTWQATLVG